MKYFLPFLALWLCSCSRLSYTVFPATTYYAVGNTWAFKKPTGKPVYELAPNQQVSVIGSYLDWRVAQRGKKILLIPDAALSLSPIEYSIDYSIASGRYILPHGQVRSRSGEIISDSNHDLYTGPRGGQYYINGNGNKTYITPQSTIDREYIQTGPRGGKYYINSNGNKTYIKH